jgi:predicted lipoprotein
VEDGPELSVKVSSAPVSLLVTEVEPPASSFERSIVNEFEYVGGMLRGTVWEKVSVPAVQDTEMEFAEVLMVPATLMLATVPWTVPVHVSWSEMVRDIGDSVQPSEGGGKSIVT